MIFLKNIKWDEVDYDETDIEVIQQFNELPTDYLLLDYPTPTDSYFCNLYVKGVLITQYNWRVSTFDISVISENPTKGGGYGVEF